MLGVPSCYGTGDIPGCACPTLERRLCARVERSRLGRGEISRFEGRGNLREGGLARLGFGRWRRRSAPRRRARIRSLRSVDHCQAGEFGRERMLALEAEAGTTEVDVGRLKAV
ncbi:unnamed protein product [Scytosiphon promiscuus]